MNRIKTRLLKQMYNRTILVHREAPDSWEVIPIKEPPIPKAVEVLLVDQEVDSIMRNLGFEDAPIWTFYDYLRVYHLIEIMVIIIMAIGAYLWLK